MRTGLSLGRDVPGMMSGMAYIAFEKKDYTTALAYLDSIDAKESPWVHSERFFPLYAMGKTKEANHLLDSLRNTVGKHIPAVIGTCFAFKKSYDSAFMYFELARKDSSAGLAFINLDRRIPANFRKDSRYKELVKFVGLEN